MKTSKWVAHQRICPEGRINLLCFAYPGGSAGNFATWKKQIDPAINLIPILYPEREVRKNDPMQATFDQFITELVEENPELFELPYAFFGYCGGAVLAYETAVLVKKRYGKEPVWGMIASSEAPLHLRDSLVAFPNQNAKEDMIAYLISLDMFDESVLHNPLFLDYYIPLLQADCKLLDTYVHRTHEPLRCDLDILFGEEDTTVAYEKTKKWETVTTGESRFHKCAGGHFFVEQQKELVHGMIHQRLIPGASL